MVQVVNSNPEKFTDAELDHFYRGNWDVNRIVRKNFNKMQQSVTYVIVKKDSRFHDEIVVKYAQEEFDEIFDNTRDYWVAQNFNSHILKTKPSYHGEMEYMKDPVAEILSYEPEDDLNSLVDELNSLSGKMGIVLNKILRIWGKEQVKQAVGGKSDWIEKAKRSRVHYAYMWEQLSKKVDHERYNPRKEFSVEQQLAVKKVLGDMKEAMDNLETGGNK